MHLLNEKGLKPVLPGMDKVVKEAFFIYSKISLQPGEALMIKISKHMSDNAKDIKEIFDHVFGKNNDKIVLYVDGDIEITKIRV